MRSGPDAQKLQIRGPIGPRGGEIVEDAVRHLDDVVGDELRALLRGDLRMLQAAFPFVDGPAGEIIGRELREDGLEIHLAVPERPVAPRAFEPALVAAVDALLRGRVEL